MIHRLSTEEALASLGTTAAGLAPAEAARRLAAHGPNALARVRRASSAWRLARELTHLLALLLWAAAALAFWAARREPGGSMATLGWAIVGVIVLNAGFSFWQETRAEQTLAGLRRLLPRRVAVVRGGVTATLGADALVPGDVVLLGEGDAVPADCRVLEAHGVRVNAATITGESLPLARDAAPDPGDEPAHARCVLLAGTALVAGRARAVVYATGGRTEFGRIAALAQDTRAEASPLQREIAHLSRVVAALAVALGAAFFAAGHAAGLPFWHNLTFAIGVIVANVPEGLLPTVSLALAMAARRMAARRALVRHLPAIEALGAATVVCTDKTGTLTLNRMAVRRVVLDGRALAPEAPEARRALATTHRRLAEGALLCHDLRVEGAGAARRQTGDPMELALVALARAALGDAAAACEAWPRVDEVPFDAERKRLSVVHRGPDGAVVYTKGAPETVLPRCTHALRGGRAELLTARQRDALVAAQDRLAAGGLRVLALAHRALPRLQRAAAGGDALEEGLVFAGLVGLEDPPRPGVAEAVARCREAGVRVVMVTGDHPRTALAIAREIGLARTTRAAVITGDALRALSAAQLARALEVPEVLFARVTAEQKLRVVAALQARGEVVAVTGDGVNDAPALRQADIGVAMGASGTDVAREAADVVLLDDDFATIVSAIEEGRAVFDNIRRFLAYILTSNIPELVPYLAFALAGAPLALTVVQILAVDLGTDVLPALALGAERPDPDVLRRPPRPRGERLLRPALLARAYGLLGVVEAAGAMAAFFLVLAAGGWRWGAALAPDAPLYRAATTACLCAIVAMQVANVFACRSERASVFAPRGRNPLLVAGVVVELALALAIAYTPVGHALFGTAPVPAWLWAACVPLALSLIAVEELRKAVARALARRAAR